MATEVAWYQAYPLTILLSRNIFFDQKGNYLSLKYSDFHLVGDFKIPPDGDSVFFYKTGGHSGFGKGNAELASISSWITMDLSIFSVEWIKNKR